MPTGENPRQFCSSLSRSITDSDRPPDSLHGTPEEAYVEAVTPQARLFDLELQMAAMKQKLSLASFVLQQSAVAMPPVMFSWHPLQLPHSRPTTVVWKFGMSSVHCKLWLFKVAKFHDSESYVCNRDQGVTELVKAHVLSSADWDMLRSPPIPAKHSKFPLHLLRYMCATLDATSVWYHPAFLSRLQNIPLDPMWHR